MRDKIKNRNKKKTVIKYIWNRYKLLQNKQLKLRYTDKMQKINVKMKLGNKKQWKVFTASVKYLFLVGYIVFSKHCAEPTRFEKDSFSHSLSCCSQETPSKRGESISPARLTLSGVGHANPVGLSPAHHSQGSHVCAGADLSSGCAVQRGWGSAGLCPFPVTLK